MKNENYTISITVNADAGESFKNICNVSGWWTRNMEGSSNNLNDVFTVRFGDTFVVFKITTFNQNKNITWLVTDSYLPWLKDKKEWNDTLIDWQIADDNGETKIIMTHIDLIPEIECYENCKKGWNFYTGESLKNLINEGKGKPDTPQAQR